MNKQPWLKVLAIATLALSSCGGGGGTVAPTPPASISRVSVDSTGTEANNTSRISSISADGRYVAFESFATNLVAGDTNGTYDIFVHDMQTGTTTRVSVDSNGLEATGGIKGSVHSSISADGRYVAFESDATNLVANDTNGLPDVFVHDTYSGVTSRVSLDSNGVEADWLCDMPSISANGRYVAFHSNATNLVANDTNGLSDVFVHDTYSGTTTRISVDSNGVEATGGGSYYASISADGRYIAFHSNAANLVAGDMNGIYDIFVHDTYSGTTTRVSVDSNGVEATGGLNGSGNPSISADSRYVAFASDTTNLVAGDTNAAPDIFVHDTYSGATTRVSVDSNGAETTTGVGLLQTPSVSADGHYVVFESGASNLVAGDTNGTTDIFVHDTQTGSTTRVNVNSNGAETTGGYSSTASISADGRYVTFESYATNLVTGDTNGTSDIFRALNR